MTVRRITAVTAPRDFRLKPENIRAGLLELQAIQASIIEQWNSSAFPVLNSLRGEAFSNGLDGGTILIDASSKPEEQGGLFWNALRERPNTIKEQCRTLGMDVAAMRRILDLKQDKTSASSSSDTDLTTIKKWIKQIAAETGTAAFVSKAQGTEFTENLFTNSPTQTESNNLRDQVGNLRSVIGGGITRTSTAIAFPANSGYINGSTTLHAALIALDTGLKAAKALADDIETEWEESGSNIYRAAGSVGIGTASPSEPLHIVSAGNGGVEIENTSGAPSLIFDMPGNEEARIIFKEDAEFRASIIWDSQAPDANALIFKGKGTNAEMARFNPQGGLEVSGTISATGTTAAAPAFTFAGDTDTGVYRPAADTIRFATGGNHALTIDSNGRVGIGATSPDQPLHIQTNNNNSDPSVIIDNNNADGTCGLGFRSGVSDNYTIGVAKVGTNFRIANGTNLSSHPSLLDIDRDTGGIGIGTTSPGYMLDIVPSSSSAFRVKGSTTGKDVNCVIENTGTDATDDALLSLTTPGGAGDAVLRLAIAGNETWSIGIDNSDGDKLKISQSSTLHTDTRVTLQGNKVGIGTTTPAKTLDVTGDLKVSGTTTLNGIESVSYTHLTLPTKA